MVLLLSKNEADCLVPQHKQNRYLIHSPTLSGAPIPRERFSPLADLRRWYRLKTSPLAHYSASVAIPLLLPKLSTTNHAPAPARDRSDNTPVSHLRRNIMAATRTQGITVDTDGNFTINKEYRGVRLFFHKEYRGVRLFFRLGKLSQDQA